MHIFEENGQLWTTTLDIAEKVNKKHFNVMRDFKKIEKVLETLNTNEFTFEFSTYIDKNGKEQPMYKLNQAAVDLLTTGYDVNRRIEIIEEFYAMKRYLEETKQIEAYNKWRIEDKKKQKEAHETIKNNKPNAKQWDYINMNKFCGTATSIVYNKGKKMMKKKEMEENDPEMLITRQKIQDDYIKAYEIQPSHTFAKNVVKMKGKDNYKKGSN
jgi:Rha family phage regulatory protein